MARRFYSQVKVPQIWNQSPKYFYLDDVRATDVEKNYVRVTDVEILKILVDLLSRESLLDTTRALFMNKTTSAFIFLI